MNNAEDVAVTVAVLPGRDDVHKVREKLNMSNRILVAYASRNGATAGVAEAIGETLQAGGAQVDVRAVETISDVTAYDAVIAGSAIREGQWLPEALSFVQTHRAALAHKPFAAFIVCMTMAMQNEKAREAVANWLSPVRALVQPVSEGYFAGSLDISKVPTLRQRMMFRVSVAAGVWTEGDHRDWNAIQEWARQLPPAFQA